MKKNTTFRKRNKLNVLLSAALVASGIFTGHAQINNPAPYCASEFFANYNMFKNIQVRGKLLDFGAEGSWTSGNKYGYYNTTVLPSVKRGDTVSIEINPYAVGDIEPIYFALWIDFNQNKTFESNELVMQNSNTIMKALPVMGSAVTPIKKTITVPGTATVGTTRARLLRGVNLTDPFGPYNSSFMLPPCNIANTGTMGNTYDFNITIGNASTSSIINQSTSSLNNVCYPNPASQNITVETNSSGIVSLYNTAGKLLKTRSENTGFVKFDISDLPDGLYIIQIPTDNGTILEKVTIKH